MSDNWASFGDGNAAEIIETSEYTKEKTGVKHIKFIFLPSKLIEAQYDIGEEQNQNGFIIRSYPATEVVFLIRGVGKTRCWIYTDFNGGPTPASRRFQELTETIEDNEKLMRSAEAAKNRAYQELDMERQHRLQAIKLQTNIVREVAKARGRVDSSEEGDAVDVGMEG
tara:strand:+ start:323 stop:826 length:504 start_codon:yes stop_codon:yes gene_type:complete